MADQLVLDFPKPRKTLIDLTGRRFGRLLVVKEVPSIKKWTRMWLCQCDCGGQREIAFSNLTSGNTSSCGCLHREAIVATGKARAKRYSFNSGLYSIAELAAQAELDIYLVKNRLQRGWSLAKSLQTPVDAAGSVDLTGRRFGRLVVQGQAARTRKWQREWLCKCDCGGMKIVPTGYLNAKKGTRSCGCLQPENSGKAVFKHGAGGTKLYAVWVAIRQRCYNPEHRNYKLYGGRGIRFVNADGEEFDFLSWAAYMGPKPFPEATVDRIDVNGDYTVGNMRWADRKTQANNTRRNIMITFRGVTKSRTEWAREIGINASSLMERLERWSIDDALTLPRTPLGHGRSTKKRARRGDPQRSLSVG